jgi:hypothetical protein
MAKEDQEHQDYDADRHGPCELSQPLQDDGRNVHSSIMNKINSNKQLPILRK